MRIEDLKPAAGSRKIGRRVGRGVGSGLGKTSGKGHKGQKARSGSGKGAGFEGGQMPLQRRLPKRGFKNRFAIEYAVVNLDKINSLKEYNEITPELLVEKRIVRDMRDGIKILGSGKIERAVTVKATAFSASASEKIAAAGGRTEVI